jgi:hypothetical protein
LGRIFSRVRLHEGGDAAGMSRDINAKAFTSGHDIFFGAGRQDRRSHEGRRLLAHELTHVVQQKGTDGGVIRRQEGGGEAQIMARQLVTDYPAFRDAVINENMKQGVLIMSYANLLYRASEINKQAYLKQLDTMLRDGLESHLLVMGKDLDPKTRLFIEESVNIANTRALDPAPAVKKPVAKPAVKGGEILSPTLVDNDAQAIYDILLNPFADGARIADILSGKSIAHRRAVRSMFNAKMGHTLELLLETSLRGDNFRAAMVYLLPALTLMERLQIPINTIDDNEEEMVEMIKDAASQPEEIAQAKEEGLRDFMLAQLSGKDLYETHRLVYPPDQYPELHFAMVNQVVSGANGTFWDDDDVVYMIAIDLTPAQRMFVWEHHMDKINFVSADRQELKLLFTGTELEVLATSMKLATEGAGTYDELAEKTVTAAKAKIDRKNELQERARQGDDSVWEELRTIGDIDKLVAPTFVGDGLYQHSFLGRLSGDLSKAEFNEYAAKLGMTAYDLAKLKILESVSFWGDDEDAMKEAFEMIPDYFIRQQLWNDPGVQSAIHRALNAEEEDKLAIYREGFASEIAEEKFLELTGYLDFGHPTFVKLIQLLVKMSEEDRTRLVAKYPERIRKFTDRMGYDATLARAVDEAARTGKVSLELSILAATTGAGTSEELVESTLGQLGDREYFQLRLGYALSKGYTLDHAIVSSDSQDYCLRRYKWLESELEGDYGSDEMHETLELVLKQPSLLEIRHPEGIRLSAFIFNQRVHDMIDGRHDSFWDLGDKFVDVFSNTGGVADYKAVLEMARYKQALENGEIDDLEFADLASGYENFVKAYQDHVAAADSAADIAGTVAAVVVAIVITVASFGTATPVTTAGLSAYIGSLSAAEIVTAAAITGTTRVAVSKMVGGEHFDLTEEGAGSFAAGAVDGVLAVMSAGIAETLQTAFFKALRLEAKLATVMAEAAVDASRSSLQKLGYDAAVFGLRGTIDGTFSGLFGNLVLTAADEATYRNGIWDTLLTFGKSMALGAGLGGVTGGIMGGGMAGVSASLSKTAAGKVISRLTKAGIDLADLEVLNPAELSRLSAIDDAILQGNEAQARELFGSLKGSLDADHAARLERSLFSESSLARGKAKAVGAEGEGVPTNVSRNQPDQNSTVTADELKRMGAETTALPDGHELLRTTKGECFVCTNCIDVTDLMREFPHSVEQPHFQSRLAEIGNLAQQGKKFAAWDLKASIRSEMIKLSSEPNALDPILAKTKAEFENLAQNPSTVHPPSHVSGRGYNNETTAPNPVKLKDMKAAWIRFLGPGPYTNIHPRTGVLDNTKLVSADGKRSIRYGGHEVGSKPTKHHYHEETWTYDSHADVFNVDNLIVRVPIQK